MIWDLLPDDPACSFIGYVCSYDLLQTSAQKPSPGTTDPIDVLQEVHRNIRTESSLEDWLRESTTSPLSIESSLKHKRSAESLSHNSSVDLFSTCETLTLNFSHPASFEPNYPHNSLSILYQGRGDGGYRSLNTNPRPPQDIWTAPPPTLNTQQSYPHLIRAFKSTADSPQSETVQDFREEVLGVPKPTINQDYKLLSFTRLPEKHAIIDNQGHLHKTEVTAQLHGMFFRSELATPFGEGLIQPELICYRRNIFQISGAVTIPRVSILEFPLKFPPRLNSRF
jgi:hypothetical protein